MINANDGGGNVSFNNGASWSRQDNQVTAQFYRVITDNQFPYRVYAGQQDNSSVSIASRTNGRGITEKDWTRSAGGESAFLAFDENNPEKVYGGSYQGNISYHHVPTGVSKDIMAYPVMGLGTIAKNMKYRFNWNSPIVASPQDPKIIYHGGNHVLMTNDEGKSWKEISPDLTRNDKEKQGPGGEPYTNEGAGGENYNTITYISASPHAHGVLYVGTDDGLVHITKDGGNNWNNITPPAVDESLINAIEVSPHDPAKVYITVTRYKWNDKRPAMYVSSNYGDTWVERTQGIARDSYIRVVREDRKVPGLLYGGTEQGLYVSNDTGMSWQPMQLNLPLSPINDLALRDNDLIVATSGRAFWILDDLSSIQSAANEKSNESTHIISPKATYKYGLNSSSRLTPGVGQNPLPGVILDYYLSEDMDSSNLRLEISDSEGSLLRTYTNKKDKDNPGAQVLKSKKGLNRFNWNMRTSDLPKVKGLKLLQLSGHTVPPGQYTATLIAEADTTSALITILAYPALDFSQADFDEQYQFMNDASDVFKEVHDAVNKMNKVKKQLTSQKSNIKALDNTTDLVALNDSITSTIDTWLEELIQPKHQTFQDIINFENQINAELLDLIGRADGIIPAVSAGSKLRLEDLSHEWNTYKTHMQSMILDPLTAYNTLYKELKIPGIVVPE